MRVDRTQRETRVSRLRHAREYLQECAPQILVCPAWVLTR